MNRVGKGYRKRARNLELHERMLPEVARRILSAPSTLRRLHEVILRTLLHWVERRGYWPVADEMAKYKAWPRKAVGLLIADLSDLGRIVVDPVTRQVELTREGFDFLNVAPVRPLYPQDPRARQALQTAARVVENLKQEGVTLSQGGD